MKEYLSKPEINFFLSILIPLVAIAVGWGVMTTRVEQLERITLTLQEHYVQQERISNEIKVSLARIETDILYIRKQLDKTVASR